LWPGNHDGSSSAGKAQYTIARATNADPARRATVTQIRASVSMPLTAGILGRPRPTRDATRPRQHALPGDELDERAALEAARREQQREPADVIGRAA
jgi:hypothetical protein